MFYRDKLLRKMLIFELEHHLHVHAIDKDIKKK